MEEGRKESGEKGDKERIKTRYGHVPAPHKEFNNYVLKTCTNNKKIW